MFRYRGTYVGQPFGSGSVPGTRTSRHGVNGNLSGLKSRWWILLTAHSRVLHGPVTLAWRSVTLGVMGVNVNINRFRPGEKATSQTPAAIQAMAELTATPLEALLWGLILELILHSSRLSHQHRELEDVPGRGRKLILLRGLLNCYRMGSSKYINKKQLLFILLCSEQLDGGGGGINVEVT